MFFHSLVRFSFPILSVMVCWISIASSADAADEILVHVFSADAPLADAKVSIDQVWVGTTAADGSLFADLPGEGTHTLGIDTPGGRVTTRLTAGAGQLVDAIVQMDRNAVFVDVFSQTEGVIERKSALMFTLEDFVKSSRTLIPHTATSSRRCTGRVIDSPLEILANCHFAPLSVASAHT